MCYYKLVVYNFCPAEDKGKDEAMVHPMLTVRDVDASIEFYTQKLGFECDMKMAGPDGRTAFAFVKLADAYLGLGSDANNPNPQGSSEIQFIFTIPEGANIDQIYADVQARGVPITGEIKDEFWGDRIFSVNDLDGYWISLAQNTREVPMDEIAEHMRSQPMN